MAFTDEQNEQIRNDLIRAARRCGITIGMRKTSVEQLTEAVGISKGSFYKFFDSKELLFFAVLEDIHTECFAAAQKSLQENATLLPAERAAAAILAACRWLSKTKAFVFIENDADFLLHRLPEEVKTAHYHDDETHIRTLLELGGLQPKGGMALAAATVRGLILTVSHQEQIGVLYPQVLETLVRGLREPYGRIAVLYFLEHRETAEIAKLVGRPPATVNSQLWRAKLLLRQQITERRQKE